MNLHTVSIALQLLCFLNTYISATDIPTYITGDISINSGSVGTSSGLNGREWVGDVKPKLPSFLQLKGSSTASTAIHKLIAADPVPHNTARISLSQFSYAFLLNPGQKIIRLHFNPSPYRGFKGLRDFFTVEAGPFTLLSNFSASLTADALGLKSFAKEFCLNIRENEQLILTFSPATSPSRDSTYAFINGIEIISVPAGLSYFDGGDTGIQVVGQKSLVHVDHNTALEIAHRLSIKPNPVLSAGDFDGVFPTWAMKRANKNRNDTWTVPVDAGFKYLIRLHFSEIGLKIAGNSDVVFKVLINEIIAQTNIDIAKESDENSIPRYRDYMVMMRGHKREGKSDILISLLSYDELIDGRGLLAGIEVFKLSNPDNNLASPNPLPPQQDSPSWIIQISFSLLGRTNAMATFVVTMIALVNIIVHKLREIWEAGSSEEKNKPSARAERLCRRFSLAELRLATRNFSDALFIGRGGFGKVYKGLIDKGKTTIAVKRLKSNSRQGAHEFLTEIETLSELRHVNLVSLIGYCNEHGEMILVYDYMGGGTLANHLYKLQRESNDCTSLTWKQRLNICIGAGRGLDYLHTGHGVIHRDVKATNILLDENLVAKVSDFGLAKHENRSTSQSHISTKVKGTKGYLDAHYMSTGKLTRKSDTYAFGVVLLEVLCGRPAVDLMLPEDEQILTKWAQENISEGKVHEIIASCLRGEISEGSLKAFVEIAERCLLDEPKKRPSMAQVILQLEFALEQQESKQLLVLNEISSVSDDIRPCDDEIDLSSKTGQLMLASIDVQNLTPCLKEQANSEAVSAGFRSGRKDGRKTKTYKPTRLWPWDAFWNRVKPPKKKELLLSETDEEIFEANIKLNKFDWNTVAVATDQFSSSQLIGQGGNGPVYKGVLPTGQLVAVKRHSSSSVLSLKEFNAEIFFLPNIMHRNIIKLLGYCIHRREKLLVYEFLQNGSVDTFIDGGRSHHLQWTVRFNIIMGIARGLLYLHQDSGLRIIHRDIKPSNILLDTEMNPKISDFSIARALADSQSELGTASLVGTLGCMSPEYARDGQCSFKSDVYSFGVTVLEIVSGRRHRQRTYSQEHLVLLDHTWRLCNEGKEEELVDESLGGAFPVEEAIRCIQVGLLCTQDEPYHRPEMRYVIKMLEGEEPIVEPQEPPPRASLLYHEAMFLQSSNSMTRLKDEACEQTYEPKTKLAKFGWDTIATATNQFSSSNKVGEGGFGLVYKGVLPTGQVVAVKRHSSSSTQGLKELKNEILWLPKLQHRNIIKLLGYCIHRDEKLLVYEFMENISLDAYRVQPQQLQWAVRFNIIMGIARGLLYLHQDSGLRIIHRNIKISNILLDSEMNPKISDFDVARTLAEHQTESGSTCTVGNFGTFGYMPPEYANHGKCSFKSDVYSFGVTVLEIVSGRTNYCYTPKPIFIFHYAWMLWNEGKAVDLVDESLEGAFPVEEALRCIQVGLLCAQEEPYDRPDMHSVIKMLEGEELILEPLRPAIPVYDDAVFGRDAAFGSHAAFENDEALEK